MSTLFPVRHFQQEFQPQRLIPNLILGLISGVLNITVAISIGVLIFTGDLSQYQTIGVGMGLIANMITGLGIGIASSHAPLLAGLADVPAVVLAAVVGSMAATMAVGVNEPDQLLTLLMAILLIVVFTGAIAWILGQLRLGNLVRFIPYPVIGGFLAGTGWFMIQGGFSVILDQPLELANLPTLVQPPLLWLWIPGVVFAITLTILTHRYRHWALFPGCIVATIGLFFMGLWFTGTSLTTAIEQGWLVNAPAQSELWQPLNRLDALPQVNWLVILQNLPSALPVVLLSIISLLLNSTAIEISVQGEMKLDRELKAFGISNILSGLGGGLIGFHIVSDTVLADKLGAKGRTACFVAVLVSGIALFSGSSLVTLFPKPMLGGLLIFLGIDLLMRWVYEAWFKFSRLEYALILIILVSSAIWGFLSSVGIGVLIACALFVFSYSRHQVIRHTFSGATHLSNVYRSFPEQRLLRQQSDRIQILLLQGYLFFGTANTLYEQVCQRLRDAILPQIQFVILDFRLVSGLDSSAVLSFIKIRQLVQKHGVQLVLTHLHPTILQQLQQGGCILAQNDLIQVFAELDRGIEWCEDQILETLSLRRRRALPLALQLSEVFASADQVSSFIHYLQKTQVPAEHLLFRQGDSSDTLYFIESGRVTIILQLQDGQTRRLRTLGAGMILGENSFYLSVPHKTSAIADQPSTLYGLSKAHLQTMRQEQPEVAAAFQDFIIRLLADRLTYAYKEIEELL
ncbi:SLC26A/SulP transporter family protein [Phormidium tenue FACHB-886]|nr:SLC26A/SulP transporter family protein [Phormidium tenue FACHB-886]